MDLFPVYLIKACLAGDIEKMEQFGIYEVLPEDFALLCEFVDPSKERHPGYHRWWELTYDSSGLKDYRYGRKTQ